MIKKEEIKRLAEDGIGIAVAPDAWPLDLFAVFFDILAVSDLWLEVHNDVVDASRSALWLSDAESRFRGSLLSTVPTATALDGCFHPEFFKHCRALFEEIVAWCASISPSMTTSSLSIRVAWTARALDAAFAGLSLKMPSGLHGRLQECWDLLMSNRTLTRRVSGLVIPRTTTSAQGNSLAHFFRHLGRVSVSCCAHGDYQTVSAAFPRSSRELRVGFVPVVHEAYEVEWGRCSGGFTVGLAGAHRNRVVNRAIQALSWLHDRGADVIVMPELVSCEELRFAVCDWLRGLSSKSPVLVVAGSEAVASKSATGLTNRAFIFGSAGQRLWTQDKANQYRLTTQTIAQYSLDPYVGSDVIQEAGLCQHQVVAIRDVLGWGRFAVLICEDFDRDVTKNAIRNFGVDVCIVVILDGKHNNTGWRWSNATSLASEPGCLCLIVNSHALLARSTDPVDRDDLALCCSSLRNPVTWEDLLLPSATTSLAFLAKLSHL